MPKMRALKRFSNMVSGNLDPGQVFEATDGMAEQYIAAGLAVLYTPNSDNVRAAPPARRERKQRAAAGT